MEPRVHFEVIHITARAALLLFLAYSAGATLATTPPPFSCRPLHRRTAPSLYRLTTLPPFLMEILDFGAEHDITSE
jgi:hypothetical protein